MSDRQNEFISRAGASLKEAATTMHARGSQYADTWGNDGCFHLVKSIVKHFTGKEIDDSAAKAITLAGFIDQKYSRFAGGYLRDTNIDLIPYLGALANIMDEHKA